MDDVLCVQCGFQGQPKRITKGSFLTELLLWLLTILGGLIYSVWRLTSRYQGCPKCESPNIIPIDSPRAMSILREQSKAIDDSLPPLQWKILGLKDGRSVTVTTVSRTAREAKRLAEKEGIVVSDVLSVHA